MDRTAALVSFRLGGSDGVAVESAKWALALRRLGFGVRTVAAEGPVDRRIPGLSMDPVAARPPSPAEVTAALEGADLVVVENLCSLPLNPAAGAVVAGCCRGRPTILHHHDLAWQRSHLAHHQPPPDDPAWCHVTINDLSRRELAERGIAATTIYNTFDPDPPAGRRDLARARLGIGPAHRLVLQPTRAIPRKNVAAGIAVAEAIGAVYWLLGPAEDGFETELRRLVERASCPVHLGIPDGLTVADAYAACDVVALPSTWEGFGNPAIESAVRRRPLAIGDYPVAAELAAFGFEWFPAADPSQLRHWLERPDPDLLDHNQLVARRDFSLEHLPARLGAVLAGMAVGTTGPGGPPAAG